MKRSRHGLVSCLLLPDLLSSLLSEPSIGRSQHLKPSPVVCLLECYSGADVVVQVTGTSLGSLTSVSFSLSGGNLTQSDSSHTLKMHPIENKPFSQLTAVLHASCPARLDLQPLLHPTLYEGAAEGTRQFASALLGEIELNSGIFVHF